MLYNVSLVEPTTGALTYVYSTGADNEVVIGGETYGFYGWNFNGKLLTDITPKLNAEAYVGDLGDEVTVYTDGKYIITAEVAPGPPWAPALPLSRTTTWKATALTAC